MNVLHIDSSVLGEASVTRILSSNIVDALRRHHPGLTVTYRDVNADAPAHLDNEIVGVVKFGAADTTDRQKAERVQTDRLVDEVLAADVVVIGAPMYNFSIPTPLKAWIDRIAQAGRTFRYTANGPEGLAGGRKVYVASARGGSYAAAPQLDHQEAYLKTVLGFLGITDVTVFRAEGIGMGPEVRAKAIAAAQAEITAGVK